MYIYSGNYDLTSFFEEKTGTTNLCLGVNRSDKQLPLKDIEIFQLNENDELQRPPGWKNLGYRLGKAKNRMLCLNYSMMYIN